MYSEVHDMEGLKSYATLVNNESKEMLQLSRKIETGFPSPAGDHLEKALRLEDLIIRRPTSTFYVRAEGNAMKTSGIYDGDILVVDRSLTPKNGSIIIAALGDEILIRKLIKKGKRVFLASGSIHHPPISINEHTEWMIWGVTTYLIHKFMSLENDYSYSE